MNLVKVNFLNYLKDLNDVELNELMNYLTQLSAEFNQDYSKFKGICLFFWTFFNNILNFFNKIIENLQLELINIRSNESMELSCYS